LKDRVVEPKETLSIALMESREKYGPKDKKGT